MRKTLAALGIAGALALGLTGCLPSQAPAPVETVTVAPEPAPEAPETVGPAPVEPAPTDGSENFAQDDLETAFIQLMAQEFGEENVDATVAIALNWCAALDSGQSVDSAAQDLAALGEEYGVPPGDLGFIVGAGVPVFCPQHADAMDEFVAANS